MSFTTTVKLKTFEVSSTQTILASDIQTIIWDHCPNKINAIKAIRARFQPIGLKDAKEIYEAVEAEQN